MNIEEMGLTLENIGLGNSKKVHMHDFPYLAVGTLGQGKS